MKENKLIIYLNKETDISYPKIKGLQYTWLIVQVNYNTTPRGIG
jgi:hypothetical protein